MYPGKNFSATYDASKHFCQARNASQVFTGCIIGFKRAYAQRLHRNTPQAFLHQSRDVSKGPWEMYHNRLILVLLLLLHLFLYTPE